MGTIVNVHYFVLAVAVLLAGCSLQTNTETNRPAFQISESLFDQSQPVTLGLQKPASINHHLVFKAQAGSAQYNHGAVLFPFKDELYIQWQSSQQDEDAPETQIL